MNQQGPTVLDPTTGKHRILTQEELRQLLVYRRAWEILLYLIGAVPTIEAKAALTIAESKALAEGELARREPTEGEQERATRDAYGWPSGPGKDGGDGQPQ